MRAFYLVLIMIVSGAADAAMFKCLVNGQPVYSDRPCGDDAKEVQVKAAPKLGTAMTTKSSESAQAMQRKTDAYIERQDIEREISQAYGRITRNQAAMRAEHVALREEMQYSRNNLGGAIRDQQLATQMEAVSTKYQTLIDSDQREIDRLNAELGRVKD
jgi:hypothetical protein